MVLSSSTSSREVGGHPEAAGTGGQSWHIGLSEFMLWANHNRAAPPQGFRWLTQYSDRLAEMHRLAITPLVLCPHQQSSYLDRQRQDTASRAGCFRLDVPA
ncbi:hypothetical protein WJX79_005841 [Trebouxia sp. C0005]